MRKEINDQDLSNVTGGRYYLNGNNHKLVFTTEGVVHQLKNCSDYQAMELMDSYIGKYSTQEEYDQACVDALKNKGWI